MSQKERPPQPPQPEAQELRETLQDDFIRLITTNDAYTAAHVLAAYNQLTGATPTPSADPAVATLLTQMRSLSAQGVSLDFFTHCTRILLETEEAVNTYQAYVNAFPVTVESKDLLLWLLQRKSNGRLVFTVRGERVASLDFSQPDKLTDFDSEAEVATYLRGELETKVFPVLTPGQLAECVFLSESSQ